MRNQFHHVNDIASTIYDVVKLKPQETLNGVKQLPLDGVSMAYTFANASAADQKGPQIFKFAPGRTPILQWLDCLRIRTAQTVV